MNWSARSIPKDGLKRSELGTIEFVAFNPIESKKLELSTAT